MPTRAERIMGDQIGLLAATRWACPTSSRRPRRCPPLELMDLLSLCLKPCRSEPSPSKREISDVSNV